MTEQHSAGEYTETAKDHGTAQADAAVDSTCVVVCVDEYQVLWKEIQAVVDAAVAKAYDGDQGVVWQVQTEGNHASSGLQVRAQSSTFSLLMSATVILRRLGKDEAADLLYLHLNQVVQSGVLPEDADLIGEEASNQRFCSALIEHIGDESIFDVDAEQYDALADKFHEEFENAAESTAEIAKKAMEKAREKLTEAGQFTEEKGEKLKEFLENDLARVAQGIKKGAQEKLNPSRLGTGALASMSKLLHKTSEVLSHFADKADSSLTCKSGEITSAGKLICKACGHAMHFKKTGRIPPCPKCHKTEFSKDY